MPLIVGANVPDNKAIERGLTHIYGIGSSLSAEILKKAEIDPAKKASEISTEDLNKIRDILEKGGYHVEGDARRAQMMAIKRLKDIGCHRGTRHQKRLPVRGQTTRVNSRTVRGNVRRTVGSGKKPPPGPK